MARDLRLFYLFRLLSTSYLFVPVSVFFARSRGLDMFEIMLLSSIYSLAVILTEVPTGVFADRFGRRPAMMAGALAMIAACGVYYAARSFWAFAAAEVLAALSMTLCSGADSAYLFDLLQDHGLGHEYARREGTASAWHQGGQTLAFAAGGLLGSLDLALPYLVTTGVATLAFFVALGLREDRPGAAAGLPSAGETVREMRASLALVVRKRPLLWAIGYSSVVFVLLRATVYIYQPYLDASGYSVAETGLVFAAVYLAATAVAHHADALRRRFAESSLLWGLLATLALTFLVLGVMPLGPWCLGVLALQAAANGLYSPLVKPLLNREIEDSRRRATVLSVESMVRRAAFGLFSPLVGLMALYGPSAGLALCGAAGVLGMALLLATARAAPQAEALPRRGEAARPMPEA